MRSIVLEELILALSYRSKLGLQVFVCLSMDAFQEMMMQFCHSRLYQLMDYSNEGRGGRGEVIPTHSAR